MFQGNGREADRNSSPAKKKDCTLYFMKVSINPNSSGVPIVSQSECGCKIAHPTKQNNTKKYKHT